jgi:23S rRNA (uracil1939-C5)-methyltransferase
MKEIDFIINDLDPLGQGVAKKDGEIFFIGKTLPEEIGHATLLKSAKKVHFAVLESVGKLQKTSPLRIPAACAHYQQCGGCHYQHTDYDSELKFKEKSLETQLRRSKFAPQNIILHPAKQRFGYRNRLQFHYDKKQNLLGMIDHKKGQILETKECLLPNDRVKEKLQEIYQDGSWKKLAKQNSGHIEIYESPNGLKITADSNYAEGGFSQVNPAMNKECLQVLELFLNDTLKKKNTAPVKMLDLFGGQGNLTFNMAPHKAVVVDVTPGPDTQVGHQQFINLNLYQTDSLKKLFKAVSGPISHLIIDPPRSGFRELPELVGHYKPKYIAYLSCQADTLMRDLSLLSEYKILNVHLFDFFPSTHHYETLITLQHQNI